MTFIGAIIVFASVAVARTPALKCDGISDDTAALRALAASAPKSGGQLNLPAGRTCVVHGTIYLSSNTALRGNGARLQAAVPWTSDHQFGHAIIENVHYGDQPSVRDTNISIDHVIFDYGDLPPTVRDGSTHAVRFWSASNIYVANNRFEVRGGADAVAGLNVINMRVHGNAAYEFRNCAYDFWTGSRSVEVYGNYAETETSVQIVNFNPERTVGSSDGLVAQGFRMQNNTLIVTGPAPSAIQLEPLGAGTAVRDVAVVTNIIVNATLALRGDTQRVQIDGNQIKSVHGFSTIMSYPLYGGRPASLNLYGNVITDPSPVVANGVVDLQAPNSSLHGNQILGGAYDVPAVFTGAFQMPLAQNTIDRHAFASVPPGTTLRAGQSVILRGLRLTMQVDSNLVLYGPAGALWSTSAYAGPVRACAECYAQFQNDGNLVLYDAHGAYWASGTGGVRGAWFNVSLSYPFLSIGAGIDRIWPN